MELPLILFYGSVAGLAAGTINGILAPLFISSGSSLWRERRLALEILSLAIHFAGGLILAFMFWLSWGLSGLVGVTWWQRGAMFGGLAWTAVTVPSILNQLIAARLDARFVLRVAIETLITCMAVALACAWSWQNGK